MKLHKLAASARAFPSCHFRKGPGIEVAFKGKKQQKFNSSYLKEI